LLPYFEFLVQIAHLLRELISLFERPRLVGKIGIQNQSIPLLKVHVKNKYCVSSLWMCTKKKDVRLVIFLCCLSTCVCVCLQVQGPLRECPRAGRFRASLLLLTTYVRPDVIWSELENFMFERAHASFGVCSESNISKQILEAKFYMNTLFKFVRVLQMKDRSLNARAFSDPMDSSRFQRGCSYLDIIEFET